MAINWPISPTAGQIYTSPSGSSWVWNGYAWDTVKPIGNTGSTGKTGNTGATGATGIGVAGATGQTGLQGIQGPQGLSTGALYYLNESVTQTPYKEFSKNSTTTTEQTSTVSIPSGSTGTQIEAFFTTTTDPGVTLIPGGLWTSYLYVDAVSSGLSVFIEIYKRNTGGTETLISTSNSSSIPTASASLITLTSVIPNTAADINDRIVVKVKASNSSGSSINATLYTEGSVHYSAIITSLSPNVEIIGQTGATGVTGADSTVPGPAGATGQTGIGIQGATGNTGADSTVPGPAGATGQTGIGIQGPAGQTGATGQTGLQGIQGVQGNVGPAGQTGQTGLQGIQGVQGNVGSPGPAGATGQTGVKGATGNTGLNGTPGTPGSPGPAGQTGQTGLQGIQGVQGNVGPAGQTGQTGQTGATGMTGLQGIAGSVGATGQTGATGPYPFYFQDTPPGGTPGTGIGIGALWYSAVTGKLLILVQDQDTKQWVTPIGDAGPVGPTGTGGGSGTIGGGGTATQIAYWNGATTLTSNSGLTYDSSTNSLKLFGSNGGLFVDTSGDPSPASYPTSPFVQAFFIGEGKTSIYNPNRMSGGDEGPAIENQNIILYSTNPSYPSAGLNGPGISFSYGDDVNTGTAVGVIQIVRAEGSGGTNEDGTLMVFGTRPNANPERDTKEGIRIGRNQWTGLYYKPGATQSPPAMLTVGTNLADDNTIGIRETNITPTQITDYGQLYVKSNTKPYFLTSGGVEYDLTAGGGGAGATATLGQVMANGATASTNLNMNNFNINGVTNIEVTTIKSANNTSQIQTINMINSSLINLMYNT